MIKKHSLLFFVFLCIVFKQASGQIVEPIHWSFSTNKLSDCEYELIINATLEGNWHLYGQKSSGPDGPIPTSFRFNPNSNYELSGSASEEKLIKKYEPVFDAELNYFEHNACFKQKIRIKSDTSVEIKGELEFMVCNDATCIPPATIPFSFKISGSPDCAVTKATTSGGGIWMNLLMLIVLILITASLFGAVKIPFPIVQKRIFEPNNRVRPVQIAAGFLAAAFALKFASNVDVILKTAIITREIFISVTIVIVGLLGIYLLGGIKISQDKQSDHLSVPRLFSAILALAFTFYLIPGLWGAPLKIIKGFPPSGSESPKTSGESRNMEMLHPNESSSR